MFYSGPGIIEIIRDIIRDRVLFVIENYFQQNKIYNRYNKIQD